MLTIQTHNNLSECHSSVCEMKAKALNLRVEGETAAGFFPGQSLKVPLCKM